MRYTLQLARYFCRLNVLTAEIVIMRGDFFGTVFAAVAEVGGNLSFEVGTTIHTEFKNMNGFVKPFYIYPHSLKMSVYFMGNHSP